MSSSSTTPDAKSAAHPRLAFVIPVMNEEETILEVLEELGNCCNQGDLEQYEVVLVDDGSTDRTREIILELAARDPRIRLIAHPENRGKSAGLVTGARAARAEWIAMLDGDGQNVPSDSISMWREAERLDEPGRPVIIAGARRKRRDTLLKRISSRVANRVRGWVLKDDTPDTGCGMKVLRTDVFLSLPRFHNMHRFLPALVLRQGGKTHSVPVEDRPRAGGVSKYGFHNRFWTGLLDMAGVWWLMRRPIDESNSNEIGPPGATTDA